ncbi:dihydrolipoyllysine-residue acetyltransferase [Thiorhodovibrio frisius]|uniref:Dihydrolipoamide acetyltransferase component of pyruvate dehydrogenase complex n=1 Tax=Thiorhodovibrio frisius TaxID=631362 RepID=H8Z533_9GAMM|nr:dihydrolipoyllysine-residue acetyltransferase [Thiorhodovibrio frisius]EIC20440.1 pyruvate/2-oxoglutarate dehydrogenase complex, dihydrolipoamide acyltransferase component [Thiorhodovibrio frisius]WPL21183.1 Dihydrolipoyllysine-residue acetyltransferase component of pyruvate dehydrogenase complex [Thiorhodovibrio frisius]
MATLEDVLLPDIGDFSDVEIIEILVAPGDRIAPEQSLLTLESDKASIEIPSPLGGEVKEVLVSVGERISQGKLLMRVATGSAGASAESGAASNSGGDQAESTPKPETAPAPSSPSVPSSAQPRTPEPAPSAQPSANQPPTRAPGEAERRKAPILPRPEDMAAIAHGRTPHASPAVRRFARELGVDLHRVKGSGRKQRILKDDVQQFVKQSLAAGTAAAAPGAPFQLPSAPAVDFSQFGPVTSEPLPRIKKISGAHLHRCWLTVPHVTQFDEADITELEAFRKGQKAAAEKAGVRLTFMPFLLKAVATALGQMPVVKASLAPDCEQLIHKHYCHIGVAVDTPKGLVVPVVRNVDQKGLFALAEELMTLSQKARDGKLLAADMQGGVFSISSLGGIGGTAFTPIVNAPEVAILGVSRTEMKPVWNGQDFKPRLMLPLSLSYDHRVVDGADGVRFTSLLRQLLSDIRRLLL